MLEVPKQAGAQGVVIWEFLESEAQFQEFRSVLTSKVIPQMNALAVNPQAPAQRAPVVATRLPNGKVVVGKSTKPTRVANVPN
jgi:hypothetical protein